MTKLTDNLKQYPHMFFNWIMKEMCLENDAELARLMEINQSTISRIRSGASHPANNKLIRVADAHILQLYDATGFSIEQLRSVLYQTKFERDITPAYVRKQMKHRDDERTLLDEQRAKQAAFLDQIAAREKG